MRTASLIGDLAIIACCSWVETGKATSWAAVRQSSSGGKLRLACCQECRSHDAWCPTSVTMPSQTCKSHLHGGGEHAAGQLPLVFLDVLVGRLCQLRTGITCQLLHLQAGALSAMTSFALECKAKHLLGCPL